MLEITWLGHGSFQFRLETGEVIVVDPWLGGPTYPADHKLGRIDIILVTHGHFDHLPDTVDLAKRHNATVVCNYEISVWLGSQGVENVSAMNTGGTQPVGPVKVSMTEALHSSGIATESGMTDGGRAGGYVVEIPDGRRFYFAGDTDVFPGMEIIRELYEPELAILPIGDHFTMGPRGAAIACRLLGAKKVIPMHFATFPPLVGRPEHLAEHIKDLPNTEVWPVEIGKPVQW